MWSSAVGLQHVQRGVRDGGGHGGHPGCQKGDPRAGRDDPADPDFVAPPEKNNTLLPGSILVTKIRNACDVSGPKRDGNEARDPRSCLTASCMFGDPQRPLSLADPWLGPGPPLRPLRGTTGGLPASRWRALRERQRELCHLWPKRAVRSMSQHTVVQNKVISLTVIVLLLFNIEFMTTLHHTTNPDKNDEKQKK